MEPDEIAELIEAGIEDARATVTRPRGPEDDDHLAATVVSPAFDDEPLVEQHRMVYDALEEEMEGPIHALSLTTKTPE